MTFEEFENQARLYAVGALDGEELVEFQRERRALGKPAERMIMECQRLNEAFALSLRPEAPRQDAKAKLMGLIRRSMGDGKLSAG